MLPRWYLGIFREKDWSRFSKSAWCASNENANYHSGIFETFIWMNKVLEYKLCTQTSNYKIIQNLKEKKWKRRTRSRRGKRTKKPTLYMCTSTHPHSQTFFSFISISILYLYLYIYEIYIQSNTPFLPIYIYIYTQLSVFPGYNQNNNNNKNNYIVSSNRHFSINLYSKSFIALIYLRDKKQKKRKTLIHSSMMYDTLLYTPIYTSLE